MPRYILQNREPLYCEDEVAWTEWIARNKETCIVAEDTVEGVSIQTVFVTSVAILRDKPQLFETRVVGGRLHNQGGRYSTWQEAERGHRDILERVGRFERPASERLFVFDRIGQLKEIWGVRANEACCLYGPTREAELLPGENLLAALRREGRGRTHPDENYEMAWVEPCARDFGEYWPRIYRPVIGIPQSEPPHSEESCASGFDQLLIQFERIGQLCRVIFPKADNLKTYGHEIRNLLLLACTEFEAQCKGVLVANEVRKPERTEDYFRLKESLALDQYLVRFPGYPSLPELCPFSTWNREKPTQSLVWYNAYNAVKHDREMEFGKATLWNAISAVAACAIMLRAQYGPHAWCGPSPSAFRFLREPQWGHQEQYLKPFRELSRWTPVNYPFDGP